MAEPTILLDYKGHIDHAKIDTLLKTLRKHKEYISLGKTISGRVYSIVVECLENIAKHSSRNIYLHEYQPSVRIVSENGKVRINAANMMAESGRHPIEQKIQTVNNLDEEPLRDLYDNRINTHDESRTNGAGLGFMLMKLRSRNNISYSFKAVGDHLWFEIVITVNPYNMRKIVLDQTSSSPKVVLDPDRNRFEISGESRPPDVTGFYTDILNWFDDYSHQLLKSDEMDQVVFNLDFNYFNSSSARYILDFCKKIADVRSRGKDLKIKWHYESDDIDMLETGREMSKMARVPFEFCIKEK